MKFFHFDMKKIDYLFEEIAVLLQIGHRTLNGQSNRLVVEQTGFVKI